MPTTLLKTREEVARFVEKQMGALHVCKFPKGSFCHYGYQELRELLDFIYGDSPTEIEKLCRQHS